MCKVEGHQCQCRLPNTPVLARAQILGQRHCAFVTFAQRGAAEAAAEEMAHKLIIRGQRCKLMWGKPQQERRAPADPMMPTGAPPPGMMVPPSMMPPQVHWLGQCSSPLR